VWQLTAVDVATRHAVVQVIVGAKTAAVTAAILDHLRTALRRVGITMTGILTDDGPEFIGGDFRRRATELGLTHHRIPPWSPNHNAVCERFHGTVLREFYRPHFHRGRVDELRGHTSASPVEPRTPTAQDCPLTDNKPAVQRPTSCHPDPCSGSS
jgi:transposase InsO family protein